jgi:hypothetical protein
LRFKERRAGFRSTIQRMPRFVDGSATIVIDDSAAPLLIATSFGVATERVTQELFAWLREFAAGVQARGSRFVVVIDARAAGRPSAAVRAMVSTLTDELRALAPGAELASLFVSESALIRGALTAIMWISRSSWRPILVESCEEAVRKGIELLRQAGIEVASPPLPYRTPPP